jgi:aurora kinase
MYELVVGKAPFEMKSGVETQKKIARFKGKGIKFPSHVSKDAEERLGFGGVLEHPWVVRYTEKSKKSGVRSLGRILEQAT